MYFLYHNIGPKILIKPQSDRVLTAVGSLTVQAGEANNANDASRAGRILEPK